MEKSYAWKSTTVKVFLAQMIQSATKWMEKTETFAKYNQKLIINGK